jgi:hypothetical protein
VARGRSRRPVPRRGHASPDLSAWPLDPPRSADRDHGHAPATVATATPPVPGALRPGRRTFFCKGCRQGVEATDCPDGWLRVQLHDAATQARDGRTFLTVALFCRLACLRTWATTTTEVSP